ncbi:MarR family winged helix-turn-helix transcriptional regulator [Gelidibacter mesophilus]|uniref:MarR family winged helix-turn-helix transcriptional regulator n=1 Tax=Gelidibacter mesophilus TaxID=169050 RepID=UPI001FDFD98B|nr:MarR family transcriptional regulator [Gelidibacter mesophilus]
MNNARIIKIRLHLYIQLLYMKELEDILMTTSQIPLAKKTVLNISYTSNSIKDSISNALKPFDLSIEQFNVLRILRGKKGKAANLQDIQNRMVSKMSNTTRLVDKLILKSFVERFVCEKNRRKVEIFITTQGLELLNELDPVVQNAETNITSPLSQEELSTLNILLTKLRN